MHVFPTNEEIKGCNKVLVLIRAPFQEYYLEGKPLKAECITAAKEINITTDKGYYSFAIEDLISVQFLK